MRLRVLADPPLTLRAAAAPARYRCHAGAAFSEASKHPATSATTAHGLSTDHACHTAEGAADAAGSPRTTVTGQLARRAACTRSGMEVPRCRSGGTVSRAVRRMRKPPPPHMAFAGGMTKTSGRKPAASARHEMVPTRLDERTFPPPTVIARRAGRGRPFAARRCAAKTVDRPMRLAATTATKEALGPLCSCT